MTLFVYFIFFILGAISASFAGVVAARFYTGQSIFTGRSRCDVCGAVLTPTALIPLLSFIVQRGHARCCGARLSPAAPLSELLLGALFVLVYASVGLSSTLPIILLALIFLIVLVLYDLTHQILPPSVLTLFVLTSAAAGYLGEPSPPAFLWSLITAIALALALAAIHLFSGGRAMGLADAPLVFGLALLTGSTALSGFLYSFWIGATIGIILLARRPRGSRIGVEVPFAPFLAAGFLLAYFTQWNLVSYLTGLPLR